MISSVVIDFRIMLHTDSVTVYFNCNATDIATKVLGKQLGDGYIFSSCFYFFSKEKSSTSPFMFLTLDLPPPPLFQVRVCVCVRWCVNVGTYILLMRLFLDFPCPCLSN